MVAIAVTAYSGRQRNAALVPFDSLKDAFDAQCLLVIPI